MKHLHMHCRRTIRDVHIMEIRRNDNKKTICLECIELLTDSSPLITDQIIPHANNTANESNIIFQQMWMA